MADTNTPFGAVVLRESYPRIGSALVRDLSLGVPRTKRLARLPVPPPNEDDGSLDAMDQKTVEEKLFAALERLLEKDGELLVRDLNERTLTHRLAYYLEQEGSFTDEDYHVDCEYNRNDREKKALLTVEEHIERALDDPDLRRKLLREHGLTVNPDIVIHRRLEMTDDQHLLVVEAKKTTSQKREVLTRLDYEKLNGFRADGAFKYKFGAFVLFRTKEEGKAAVLIDFIHRDLDDPKRTRTTGNWEDWESWRTLKELP